MGADTSLMLHVPDENVNVLVPMHLYVVFVSSWQLESGVKRGSAESLVRTRWVLQMTRRLCRRVAPNVGHMLTRSLAGALC